MDADLTRIFAPRLPSPVTELRDDRLRRHGVRVLLKRDDLIHPDLPGNKWRKLKFNLAEARWLGHTTLLTFGGAHSNHIRAVAAAGRALGFATIGVIRGEERPPLNPSLAYAAAQGMRLTYLDRSAYRRKDSPDLAAALRRRHGDFYRIPEGGSNALAVKGCAELPGELDVDYDLVCCACGTGGTLAGIAAGLPGSARALGFQVLKGGDFLSAEVRRLQREAYGRSGGNWSIDADFHFGGFARSTPRLRSFIAEFGDRHGVDLDHVYNAKMLYGLFRLIEAGRFRSGTTIVAVKTG